MGYVYVTAKDGNEKEYTVKEIKIGKEFVILEDIYGGITVIPTSSIAALRTEYLSKDRIIVEG